MNRCIGFNKFKKRCRAPISSNRENQFFCCKSHEPFNMEIFEDGCFICGETEIKKEEYKMAQCDHLIHKPCHEKWLEHSTYAEDVCYMCRQKIRRDIENNQERKWKKTTKGVKKNLENEGISEDFVYNHLYHLILTMRSKINNNGNNLEFK